ncbi:MAG: hypothetical protein ABSA33_02385 [Candidatus Micrarchaeaceae archaeon]|jgi:hypothetical protein
MVTMPHAEADTDFKFRKGNIAVRQTWPEEYPYATYSVRLPVTKVQETVDVIDGYMRRRDISTCALDNIFIKIFIEPAIAGTSAVLFRVENKAQNDNNANFGIGLREIVKEIGDEINNHYLPSETLRK